MAGIFDSISVLVLLLLLRKIQAAPETQLILLPSDCGTGIVVDDDKVYTGNEAHVASYPWMAILRYYSHDPMVGGLLVGRFEDSCVGSLINSRYVLTAAQCVKYYEP
ncbi:serine protease 7-like [Aedes albopictus]|uniref:Peptidase S1 domain-containing protein n=1 Tax=Aedes albopictus TaxID=7160 RepID=A0ABM1XQ69_AEDAL